LRGLFVDPDDALPTKSLAPGTDLLQLHGSDA
jgi:hypothetical protein